MKSKEQLPKTILKVRELFYDNPSTKTHRQKFITWLRKLQLTSSKKRMFLEKTLEADPFHAEAYNELNNNQEIVDDQPNVNYTSPKAEPDLTTQSSPQDKTNLHKGLLILMLCIGIPVILFFLYLSTRTEGSDLLAAFDAGSAECERYQQGTVNEINCTARLNSLGEAMMSSLNNAVYLGFAFFASLVISFIALFAVFLFRRKIFR